MFRIVNHGTTKTAVPHHVSTETCANRYRKHKPHELLVRGVTDERQPPPSSDRFDEHGDEVIIRLI
jgi:hypothetical protein